MIFTSISINILGKTDKNIFINNTLTSRWCGRILVS